MKLDNDKIGTFSRTIRSFLDEFEPTELFVCVENGRAHVGHKSKHRTPSGVKYNRLMRLRQRLNDSVKTGVH